MRHARSARQHRRSDTCCKRATRDDDSPASRMMRASCSTNIVTLPNWWVPAAGEDGHSLRQRSKRDAVVQSALVEMRLSFHSATISGTRCL